MAATTDFSSYLKGVKELAQRPDFNDQLKKDIQIFKTFRSWSWKKNMSEQSFFLVFLPGFFLLPPEHRTTDLRIHFLTLEEFEALTTQSFFSKDLIDFIKLFPVIFPPVVKCPTDYYLGKYKDNDKSIFETVNKMIEKLLVK